MFAKLGRFTPLIVLLVCSQSSFAAEKIRVLLVDGQNNHNWRSTSPIIKASLETTGKFTVDVTSNLSEKEKDKPGSISPKIAFPPLLENYDVVVSNYNGASWPNSFNTDLESRLKEGKIGLVIIHAANNAFGGWKEYNQMIGMGWRDKGFGKRVKVDDQGQAEVIPKGQGDSTGHRYTGVFTVVVRDTEHPITKGMPKEWAHPRDELYDNLRGPAENLNILATSFSPGTKTHEPMIFTISYGKGRVFHTPLGHDAGAMGCAGFQATVERGTEWAATGKVSQKLPSDFPTEKVSLRK